MENTIQLSKPFENYCINELGEVYNIKTQHQMKYWEQRNKYLSYTLINSETKKKQNKTLHRLLATTYIDNPNEKPCVDHKDRNKQNNSLENLRWVSYSENAINKPSTNKISRGLYKTKYGKYYAVLVRNKKRIYLGCRDTAEEAKNLYENAVNEYDNPPVSPVIII